VLVDMDAEDEYVEMFEKMWPEGLQKLKTIAEV
jgi:L-rhamnose mutarotase